MTASQPTVEAVADVIHGAFDLDTPEDGEPCYCDLDAINDAARSVLALLPGRPERVVKAEAIRDTVAKVREVCAGMPGSPLALWLSQLETDADRMGAG